MRIFETSSYDSLQYVYTTYLSNPFSDTAAYRGSFIDKLGVYQKYPEKQLVKDPAEVYRPNHGLAHNVRVTFKVRDMIALYADPNANTHAASRGWFEQFNKPDEMTKLEIAGSFYVACRESEANFSSEPGTPYQRYREASSNAFYQYAKDLKLNGKPLFTEEELQLYKTVLKDPYFDKPTDGPALLAQNEYCAKKAAAKAVLSSCHALDLARCFSVEKMNHKIIEVLDPLGEAPNVYSKSKVAENFVRSEIQHILTGNKCHCIFDPQSQSFEPKKIFGKNYLFRIAGTHPDIAMRLVSLSSHIKTVDQAKQLALSLDQYATKGAEALTEFLSQVEQCFSENPTESIDALLAKEKLMIKNTRTGRIFKTIRADQYNYWEKFVTELVDPEKPEARFEKRKEGKRFYYTIRLNPVKNAYEIVETKKNPKTKRREKPLYDQTDKMSVTKHQSVSYTNPATYKPPVFGFNRDRKEVLVGVSFDPKDCLFWSMMLYDGGTYDRPYDFSTRKTAQVYLDNKIKTGSYCTSFKEIETTGNKDTTRCNEILAGLKWNLDGTSQITIFSDNLESRLLAQLRALDLQKRLEKKYPDKKPMTVPISIYPDINDPNSIDFNIYTPDDQQHDLIVAKNDLAVSHYADAIHFMTTGITFPENPSAYLLLEKLGKSYAEDYFSKINNHVYSLMVALSNAAFKNSAENTAKITNVALEIIQKCEAHSLAAGLSEKATAGANAGKNGFYWLMVALCNATFKNSAENTAKITNVALEIIQKCEAHSLAAGLSEKATAGANAGRNGFYWLMGALSNATFQNSAENTAKITNVALEIIQKCEAHSLAAGLSEKATASTDAGMNGFYWLMAALNNAAFNNSAENTAKITNVALEIIQKCEAHSLAAGLSEKATAGANAGRNGFYWLMGALSNATFQNSAENTAKIAEIALKVIEKLPLTVLIDCLKALDTNLRKKVYEIADKLSAADNLNKLKIALISKLMAYRDSNGVGPGDKNASLGFFTLSSTLAKLGSAKKLMEEIITCSTARDIRSKIGEQQYINSKLDASRKLLIGKSTYEKCLDDCLSKTSDYCTVDNNALSTF